LEPQHDRLMKFSFNRSARRDFSRPGRAARYWPGLLLAAALLGPSLLVAQAPPPFPQPGPPRPRRLTPTNLAPSRLIAPTNLPPSRFRGNVKTNPPAAALRGASGTNAVAAPAPAGSPFLSGLRDTFNRLRTNPSFYPGVGISLFLVVLVVVRLFSGQSQKPGAAGEPKAGAKSARRAGATGAVHSCNILEVGPQARQVWHFDVRGSRYVLSREHTCVEGDPLPRKVVAKDWRSLFQRKLNVAWLPSEQVFLRVAQFPKSDFSETVSMVELQLEKLSPIPVAQIAWTLQVLPHAQGNLQTVIVTIVARSVVEEFLGKLEADGYLADRLELPLVDQLQTTAITEDGAWIFPEAAGGRNSALVGWWYGGVLQNLDLVTLPEANRGAALKEQLMQMTWAGELEGWLAAPPHWHLVADEMTAAQWEPALREGLEQPVEIIKPLPNRELAALTARRSAQAEAQTNLLPEEFAARYHQQFTDRLWLRGLMAVAAIYLLYVGVYMARLGYATMLTHGVETEVASLGSSYTNAIQLRDKYKVLRERQELKFAGLDCWNATARNLPPDATLESLNFSQGKRLNLSGTASPEAYKQMLDFDAAMRKATKDGEPLFDPVKGETLVWRVQGPVASWSVGLDLKRTVAQ
jgi:hypothetical protein